MRWALAERMGLRLPPEIRRDACFHAQVAALAGTSQTRITALLNRNTEDISADRMLRVLGALRVSAKITFGRAA